MEKYSTDRQAYFNKIIEELCAYNSTGALIYCEVGHLLTHGFSFQYERSPHKIVRMKIWDANYDNSRFRLGVFNLDRLAIHDQLIHFDSKTLEKLDSLTNFKLNVITTDRITVDGLSCQLRINGLRFNWNADDEMNDALGDLVHLIRTISNVF